MSEIPLAAIEEGGEGFCPECGQSLDLTRHHTTLANRRTPEPIVFLIFGLCLVIVFGFRAWDTHLRISNIDQKIMALRAQAANGIHPTPGNPAMIVADMLDDALTDQLSLDVAFQRDVTGLGLGFLAVVVGAVCWLRERPEVWDQRRKRLGLEAMRPSSQLAGVSLWNLGDFVARTLVRVLLIMFVALVRQRLILGVPTPLELFDQVLTRLVVLVDMAARVLL